MLRCKSQSYSKERQHRLKRWISFARWTHLWSFHDAVAKSACLIYLKLRISDSYWKFHYCKLEHLPEKAGWSEPLHYCSAAVLLSALYGTATRYTPEESCNKKRLSKKLFCRLFFIITWLWKASFSQIQVV